MSSAPSPKPSGKKTLSSQCIPSSLPKLAVERAPIKYMLLFSGDDWVLAWFRGVLPTQGPWALSLGMGTLLRVTPSRPPAAAVVMLHRDAHAPPQLQHLHKAAVAKRAINQAPELAGKAGDSLTNSHRAVLVMDGRDRSTREASSPLQGSHEDSRHHMGTGRGHSSPPAAGLGAEGYDAQPHGGFQPCGAPLAPHPLPPCSAPLPACPCHLKADPQHRRAALRPGTM